MKMMAGMEASFETELALERERKKAGGIDGKRALWSCFEFGVGASR